MRLGFKITGMIRINADIKKVEEVTKELNKLKPIWFIVNTTGDSDIYTEFVTRSIDELDELLFKKINKIDGIIRTETSLILKFIKRRYDLGTGYE